MAKFIVKGHRWVDPNLPSSHWIDPDFLFDNHGPNATATSFAKPIDTTPNEQDHDLFALVGSLGRDTLFVSWHSGLDGYLYGYTSKPCSKCSPPQSSIIAENGDVYFAYTCAQPSGGVLMRVHFNNGTAVAVKRWEDKAVRSDQLVVTPSGFAVFMESASDTNGTIVEELTFLNRAGSITSDIAVGYTGYWQGLYQRLEVLDDGELTVSGMWVQLNYQNTNEEGLDPSPRELAILPREDGKHLYNYGKLPAVGKDLSLDLLKKP
ncbi:hypothetical protein HDV00_010465 [Rhizophlyctis rosea]|nr:hypothetical protein HDV00_010465 [Rhizophlyctis rosea]